MALSWALQAVADLEDILDHYTAISPDLAYEVIDHIFDSPRMLVDFPHLGRPAGAFDLRKWAVRHTPFILLYRVSEARVEIARIVHSASDWQRE